MYVGEVNKLTANRVNNPNQRDERIMVNEVNEKSKSIAYSTYFDIFNSSDHLEITAILRVAVHSFGCVNIRHWICLKVHVKKGFIIAFILFCGIYT